MMASLARARGRACASVCAALCAVALLMLAPARAAHAQAAPADATLPELTQPVNDFAKVIDPQNAAEIDRVSRVLMAATTDKDGLGDTIIIVTVPTFAPFGDIRQYAVKLFENHGRGIGDKKKDNGLLVVLAVNDRKVWIEVGYGLEGFITDGFSGETSRQFMAPHFKEGRYGDGLRAGVTRIAARIAQGRGVSLEGVRAPEPARESGGRRRQSNIGLYIFLGLFLFTLLRGAFGGGPRRRRSLRWRLGRRVWRWRRRVERRRRWWRLRRLWRR